MHQTVGIVLGRRRPKRQAYRELQARLDVAAQAVYDGQVDKLILSGDNRFQNYNEPAVMQQYLLTVKHIPASKLQPDYAGRDTYHRANALPKSLASNKQLSTALIRICRGPYFCVDTLALPPTVFQRRRATTAAAANY